MENSAERGGCVTLTDIWEEGEGKLPLYPFDASNNESKCHLCHDDVVML